MDWQAGDPGRIDRLKCHGAVTSSLKTELGNSEFGDFMEFGETAILHKIRNSGRGDKDRGVAERISTVLTAQ